MNADIGSKIRCVSAILSAYAVLKLASPFRELKFYFSFNGHIRACAVCVYAKKKLVFEFSSSKNVLRFMENIALSLGLVQR